MKEKINKHEDIKRISSYIKGNITSDYWSVEDIKFIRMKDGTFALGIDIDYIDADDNYSHETFRIRLDENNVPYIRINDGHDFTEENCADPINSHKFTNGGFNHRVKGHCLMNTYEASCVCEKSIFNFTGKSIKEPHVRDYFANYTRYISLNPKGLSLIIKYIEDSKNKELLNNRTRRPSEAEVLGMQQEVRNITDKFFGDSRNNNQSINSVKLYQVKDMIDLYNIIVNEDGLIPDEIIMLDLFELDMQYSKPQGQPD